MKKLMVAAMISMVFAPFSVGASEIEHRGSGLTEAQKKEQSRNEDRQRAARASGIAGIYPYPVCRIVIVNEKKYRLLPDETKNVLAQSFNFDEKSPEEANQINDAILAEFENLK